MESDPNKRMDELLRGYAKERRKAAPAELHPATRAMLQGEAARQYPPPPAAQPVSKRWASFWPRLAFAGALGLVFCVAVLSLRPHARWKETSKTGAGEPEKMESEALQRRDLKETESAERTLSAVAAEEASLDKLSFPAAPGPTAPPSPVPSESSRTSLRLGVSAETLSLSDAEEAKAPVSVSLRSAALAEEPEGSVDPYLQNAELKQRYFPNLAIKDNVAIPAELPKPDVSKAEVSKVAVRPEVQSVAVRPVTIAASLATAASLTNLGAARRMSFSYAPENPRGPAAANQPSVLRSFQIEQLGDQVRILDRDGSVYVGALTPENAGAAPAGASTGVNTGNNTKLGQERRDNRPAAVVRPEDWAGWARNSARYEIRAQGTNRLSGQSITLSGKFLERTNFHASRDSSAPNNAGARGIRPAPGLPPVEAAARRLVVGQAFLGGTNPVPVRALSTEP